MNSLRYIHAADLHLDTPFLGLSRTDAGEALQAQLRDATFTALQRLFDQCERLRPDFLVLAGDIYNQEEHSVKAQLALRDGCVRLQACGIPVFWAHGNHDPLDSRLKAVDWPDNVTIFGPEPEQHVLYRDGAPLAVIHGMPASGRPATWPSSSTASRRRIASSWACCIAAWKAAPRRTGTPPARWTICAPPVWMPGPWAMCTNAAFWRAIPSSPIPAIPRDSTSMKAARAVDRWSLPRPATVLSPAGKNSCRWGRYNGSVRSSVWTPWTSSTPWRTGCWRP